MKTVCYLRVSTTTQDHDAQRVRLQEYIGRHSIEWSGQIDWLTETGSGAKRLPVRDALLERARREPLRLVVWKLDRLGRSAVDVLTFCDLLARTGSELVVIELGLDTSTPWGRFGVTVLAAAAELERAFTRERAAAGRIAAREKGVRFGRPRKSLSTLEVLEALLEADRKGRARGLSRTRRLRIAAAALGCSIRTLGRWIAANRPEQKSLADFGVDAPVTQDPGAAAVHCGRK